MSYMGNILNESFSQLKCNWRDYLFLLIFLTLLYIAIGLLSLIDLNLKKNLFTKANHRTLIISWHEKNDQAIKALLENIKRMFHVEEIKIFTPEDAKRILTETTPLNLNIDNKTSTQILSYTAVIKLDSTRDELAKIMEKLRNIKEIEEVLFEPEKMDVLSNLWACYKYISISITLLFAAVIILITIAIFRIIILTTSKKLYILHMIGASTNFIRLPYILISAILGILGTAIGLLFLKIVQLYLKKELYIPPLWLSFDFLQIKHIIILSIINIFLPIMGSYFIVRKIK